MVKQQQSIGWKAFRIKIKEMIKGGNGEKISSPTRVTWMTNRPVFYSKSLIRLEPWKSLQARSVVWGANKCSAACFLPPIIFLYLTQLVDDSLAPSFSMPHIPLLWKEPDLTVANTLDSGCLFWMYLRANFAALQIAVPVCLCFVGHHIFLGSN